MVLIKLHWIKIIIMSTWRICKFSVTTEGLAIPCSTAACIPPSMGTQSHTRARHKLSHPPQHWGGRRPTCVGHKRRHSSQHRDADPLVPVASVAIRMGTQTNAWNTSVAMIHLSMGTQTYLCQVTNMTYPTLGTLTLTPRHPRNS